MTTEKTTDKALDHVARKIVKQQEQHRAINEAVAIVSGFESILRGGPQWEYSPNRIRATGRRVTLSMEREVAAWLLERAQIGVTITPRRDPLIAFSDAVHGKREGS